ncbi:MAG: hypothetical protein ACXADU_08230 [Promethearchaeota archaeon]|jgi:hypothetical protein
MTKETELVTKMTEETKTKPRNGGSMGLISIILGAAQECRLTAPFFIPAFAVVGIVGGMLWLTAGVGFFQRKGWAYSIAVIAVIITLFSSFWPNIPAMESGVVVPGPWFLIFFPNLLVYFILVGRRGKEPGTKALLGLIIGMAFILNFINGIAATTRMMNRLPDISLPTPDYSQAFMYMLTMPTNMIASILFGLFHVLFRRIWFLHVYHGSSC